MTHEFRVPASTEFPQNSIPEMQRDPFVREKPVPVLKEVPKGIKSYSVKRLEEVQAGNQHWPPPLSTFFQDQSNQHDGLSGLVPLSRSKLQTAYEGDVLSKEYVEHFMV